MLRGQLENRPKTIAAIRQKRLAAREHLRAVGNILKQMDLDLCVPQEPLRPIDPSKDMRGFYDRRAFRWDGTSGTAVWDSPDLQHGTQHLRLVLQPDEGSPLWSAFQYLVSKNAAVHFIRDEPYLGSAECISASLPPEVESSKITPRHKLHAHFLRVLSSNTGVQRSLVA